MNEDKNWKDLNSDFFVFSDSSPATFETPVASSRTSDEQFELKDPSEETAFNKLDKNSNKGLRPFSLLKSLTWKWWMNWHTVSFGPGNQVIQEILQVDFLSYFISFMENHSSSSL